MKSDFAVFQAWATIPPFYKESNRFREFPSPGTLEPELCWVCTSVLTQGTPTRWKSRLTSPHNHPAGKTLSFPSSPWMVRRADGTRFLVCGGGDGSEVISRVVCVQSSPVQLGAWAGLNCAPAFLGNFVAFQMLFPHECAKAAYLSAWSIQLLYLGDSDSGSRG